MLFADIVVKITIHPISELAEIVEVDEITPVLEVVKEGVEEVSSEWRCLNCDAEMTFDPLSVQNHSLVS